MSFLFINKNLRLNNLKTRTGINAKILVFVICVKAIVYLLSLNLRDCTCKGNHESFEIYPHLEDLSLNDDFFSFFNCYLAAPRPTLNHCRWGSLTNPMLITRLGAEARSTTKWSLNRDTSDFEGNSLTQQATVYY